MTRHQYLRPLALAVALCLLAPAALTPPPASAFTLEEFQFESPAEEKRFRDLISKLRCLVCQNESLEGSQADLAQDLRKEVYGMMREGQGNQEIIDFLVERYGDFVLYEPPLKPSTYVLWFGPFVLLGLGGLLLLRALAAKKAEPDASLSEAERNRLAALLAPGGGSTATPDAPAPGSAKDTHR
jgi:cytochrome c-type biogenesis protein CcmH